MTRSAISPRLAIKTFLNMRRATGARCRPGRASAFLLERIPALVARTGDALDTQRKLRRRRCVEKRTLVRDGTLRVPLHQRLVEGLHPVLCSSLFDEVRDVQRFFHV